MVNFLERIRTYESAHANLFFAAQLWFLTAVTGQLIFAYYIFAYYGGAIFPEGLSGLGQTHLPKSYIPGDNLGNIAIAAHLMIGAILTLGGPLQIIPHIRNRFPAFHRWNGRTYMVTAFIVSISGLYMVLVRGAVGGLTQHISLGLNGILIMIFAILALRHAMARRIAIHQRWALRLFITVSGVWFARLGLWSWMLINGGPVGFDPRTFQGPFLDFLGFAQYLLPLAILELYLRSRDSKNARAKLAMAGVLVITTILTGTGIYAATMGTWLPRI